MDNHDQITKNLCPICHHQTDVFEHPKFQMTFHVCPVCQYIFKDHAIHPSDEDAKKQYDYHQNSETDRGYVNFLTNFIDAALIPYVKDGHILDYGSGPNPVLATILRDTYGFEVTIYDLFYANDLTYLNHCYDAITSTEVIEHINDPVTLFETFHQLLKPQGILAIMTLFHPNDLTDFSDWFYIRDITHVSFYRPKTIEYLAKKTGFEIIDTNHHRYITLKKIGE